MTNYGVIPSRAIWPHTQINCSQCSVKFEFPSPTPPPPPNTALRIRCFQCGTIVTHMYGEASQPSLQKGEDPKADGVKKKGRTIGTQERPLETAYYEILGVGINATTEEIKRAYHRLAIKHHPDKNRDDPNSEEIFKQIGIAYQTLSDPELRKKYNEFGSRESQPEGGFMDPEAFFSQLFGGERFVPLIGHISLGRDMKAALQQDGETEGDGTSQGNVKNMSPDEKARKEEKARQEAVEKAAMRESRVQMLAEELTRKLSIFTESAVGENDTDVSRSWRTICELDAEQLKHESHGVELLHTIGFVYASKARHHLASNQTFMGVGGWLHNVQGKYHVFSETMSTIKATLELKQAFDQISAAEKSGPLSADEKRKLEEAAAEKGIQALFKGTKLEIESVLRETCERVLSPDHAAGVAREKLHLRAVALQMMGEAFMGVQKEGVEESEYVRVETRESRARVPARG